MLWIYILCVKLLFWFLFCVLPLTGISLNAQSLTQTIRGVVVDANIREPLIGAEIYVNGIDPVIGTVSDGEGQICFGKDSRGSQDRSM